MNELETITWKTFKLMLTQNAGLYLQFKYAANNWVNAAYHITEIKQTPITSVDCGGVMNTWTEIIIQLWEPKGQRQEYPMKVEKALSIIHLVETSLSLDVNAIVKIEFGNSDFDTRQMLPAAIITDGGNLIIDLLPDAVQCKAINRGGSCGTSTREEECCSPVQDKQEVSIKDSAVIADACCTPGSGCC